MSKRSGRKFKPFNDFVFSTPVSNFNTTPTDNGKSYGKGGSQKKDIEKNTSRSENLLSSKGQENVTETDYQVSENVSDQSNAYVASKIQTLSVSSCRNISSEKLDVKVEISYTDKVKGPTKCYDEFGQKSSPISSDKTISKSRENLTNDTQIDKKGFTNQTNYSQKMNRDSKRFKEGQRGNHSRSETKWGDDKKYLRDQGRVSNKSFDTQRSWNSPRENDKNRFHNHNYSQGSKNFEDGQRNRYKHNQNKSKWNNSPDLKEPQTVSNNSLGTQNFEEENWDSPPKNENTSSQNRFDNHNFSQNTNRGSKYSDESQRRQSFSNRNKSKWDENTPDLKQQQSVSNNFLGTQNFQEKSRDSPSEKYNSNNDNISQKLFDESTWDEENQEENWDSPQENETSYNKNCSDIYNNSATNVGREGDYNSEPHVETSNSGILNVDAQEYIPPPQADNEPEIIEEYTEDDYFSNNVQSNKLKIKSLEMDKERGWRSSSNRHSFPMVKSQQNFTKRYSDGSNKESRSNETSRDWRSESSDKEFRAFCDEERRKEKPKFIKVNEIQQDLFAMPKEYSLGHCVARDMRMGSGIAVHFKREFKDLGALLNQNQKPGGLAVLEDENNGCTRYIYYLVTKRDSTGKPTYENFWSSVKKMRDHIRQNDVHKLAIPRLGCGLDRLEWDRVKHMIEFLFRDVEVEITVCNFQQTEDSPEKPLIDRTCKVVHELKSIADIAEETTIIYLSSEDGHVSSDMEQLSKKYLFLQEFKRTRRQLGSAVKYQVPNKYFILYGCIVRKTNSDLFDFVAFNNCLKEINKNNRKDGYVYVGIQAIKDDKDDLLMPKIITLLRNTMSKVDIYVCWEGDLAGQMPVSRYD